jgi:hypothetical protein
VPASVLERRGITPSLRPISGREPLERLHSHIEAEESAPSFALVIVVPALRLLLPLDTYQRLLAGRTPALTS